MSDLTHTIDEALAKFTLIPAQGDGETTACVMTALSWVAGEAWSDHPDCAHPILANLAIRANDHGDTTPERRADIVRAGATGLIDTWWLPGEVVAWCISEGMKTAELPVERCLSTLAAVTAWKVDKARPNISDANLRGADLGGADLGGADLGGADLRGAYLRDANLRGAYLWDANLRDANLRGVDLRDANLRGVDLEGANLWGANLGGADLWGANLRDAYLWGADLRDADGVASAPCSRFTTPPTGWTVNTTTWRMELES